MITSARTLMKAAWRSEGGLLARDWKHGAFKSRMKIYEATRSCSNGSRVRFGRPFHVLSKFALCALASIASVYVEVIAAAQADPAVAPPYSPQGTLAEILISGHEPVKDVAALRSWFARLTGEFAVEGTLELYGPGGIPHEQPVQGRGICETYFPNPGAQCGLELQAPAWNQAPADRSVHLPHLGSAILLLGYVHAKSGIIHQLVDSNGIAEGDLGFLISSDTLLTKARCPQAPGGCERTLRITASGESSDLELEMGTRDSLQAVAALRLNLRRVQAPASIAIPKIQ